MHIENVSVLGSEFCVTPLKYWSADESTCDLVRTSKHTILFTWTSPLHDITIHLNGVFQALCPLKSRMNASTRSWALTILPNDPWRQHSWSVLSKRMKAGWEDSLRSVSPSIRIITCTSFTFLCSPLCLTLRFSARKTEAWNAYGVWNVT